MAVTDAPPISYTELGKLYEHQLEAHGVGAVMLTHKWQPADLLAPHSDIDVRVLLPAAPADWEEWNHRLAAAHTTAVAREVSNRRLLEHPPGFAFTVAEVDDRLVSAPEVATWSLISGSVRDFQRWKSRAQMAPWCDVDERFYRGILQARLGGWYQLAEDSADNVVADIKAYRRHCVAWHYAAPCWFAAASLATRTRCPGKTAALTQWRPDGLDRYAEVFLRHNEEGPSAWPRSPRHLLREAHIALEAAMRLVPSAGRPADLDAATTRTACAMAAGMLRVRVARWLYYLDPPPGVTTEYLIRREAKELRSAAQGLNAFAEHASAPARRLTARMAELIPTGPTTTESLRTTLLRWHQHKSTVQDFLSLTLSDLNP
ncbi:hypothetical protein [Streptomyces sp. TS71-3]|uniref:hypothetical protein n=1 Tax=Streptomyces sp. TS71-3 TaxID=2733862 RepID=UPI001B0AD3C7|nr:hypothetical protein [Streptomyces sp. TS71-3]GHJ40473.1 hypothetical protein Sm713_60820 [Streptomyces sp. TS71-3]